LKDQKAARGGDDEDEDNTPPVQHDVMLVSHGLEDPDHVHLLVSLSSG
jgi:hypothetical protein